MPEADRRAQLQARVYGREADPAAVKELQALLAPVVRDPTAAHRVAQRRPRGAALVAAVALSAIVLASAAWEIGAVGGRAAPPTASAPSPSAPDRSGAREAVDVFSGSTVWFSSSKPSCSTGEVDNDAACAAANEFQQMLRARSRAQSLAARSRR